MKTFRWLMVAMMTLTLSLVACEKDKPEPQPQPEPQPEPQPVELTFDVETLSTTKSEATFNITPSSLEADYIVAVVLKSELDADDYSDAEIVGGLYLKIQDVAEANGTTFEAFMAEKVKRGALEAYKVENLIVGSDYYLLVFGVDVNNSFALSGKVTKHEFSTEANQQTPPTSSCTFEVKANVNLTAVALNVKPSDNNQLWHLINAPVAEYEAYTSADGEYGWTKEEYFQNYLNTEIATLKEQGLSVDEIGVKLFHKGVRTLNDSGLQPKTKYVTFTAAVDYTDGAAVATSALKELRYNSGEAAESNLTFDIDVYNISNYSAEVRITPSDLNANYYYYIGYIDSQKKSMKPIDIANAAVTEYIYYWENYTELKHRDPVTGVTDLTGENKVELNIAETEYFVVAFSFEPNPTYGQLINEETGEYDYNPGTITSAPVYVSFMTAEQGDPYTANFTISASDVGPYDFYLEIKADDPTIYYQPGIAYADNFDPQAALDASSPSLAQLVQMTMEGQSPSLTFWEALEEKLTGYYRNGDGKYYVANLEPNRDYIGYVLAIDAENRKFARCVYSEVIATTTNIGSVTPELELLGVYNGEHEAGTIFGDKNLTSGRPIVAVKLNNIENATAAFAALSTDPYADVAALSDRYIISEFRGYWQQLSSIEVPYHFFVAEWDVEQTVVAYAQDQNGHEAKVARMGVTPVSAGDIEELRGYVDAVNNASAQAVAKSMVIAEVAEPTMECVWSQEVGAPRAAEVIYHEVEPLHSVASDLVKVRVIKSFYF
ncbi:MAG: hypothetical protein J6Q95_07855 [Alistipes sp.]|nr:hypothetical protein [Alistipes sp.]